MSALASISQLWSQAVALATPEWLRPTLLWLYLFGSTDVSVPGLVGGLIYWFKVVSLFCLIGWVVSWLVTAFKERLIAGGKLDIAALVGILGGIATLLLHQLVLSERMPRVMLGPISLVALLGLVSLALVVLWIEAGLWRAILRLGRGAELTVLVGMHAAMGFGLVLGFNDFIQMVHQSVAPQPGDVGGMSWKNGLILGARLGLTYMGYVVLVRVAWSALRELVNVRIRRLLAIARLSVIESNRRMWAPWVVLTVFLVILAFAHWFLQPPRPAEMGRLFVSSLTLLCSMLLLAMVTILTPLSLPQDIQNQTIYTVVSKPVRRIELIWGRMIGFMAIVTVLVLIFGAIDLMYLSRTVGGTIRATEDLARKEADQNRPTQARVLREQAEQLRTRMSARVPVKGSLTFLDSYGNPHNVGIDVGQEQRAREPRSHIEGATPATAIWRYGFLADPHNPHFMIDRRIPVSSLLTPGTIEGLLDQTYELRFAINRAQEEQRAGKPTAARAKELEATIDRSRDQLSKLEATLKDLNARAHDLEAKARDLEAGGKPTEAAGLLQEAAALHSRPIPMEMSFNVYRTTKGKIGEPVYAEMEVSNPNTNMPPVRKIFPIREYYTNKQMLPPYLLAGSRGALKVEIRCISPTQYLGMSESDLYILVETGNFGANFMKGLFGVWLQAMVLTAIGVWAGTFLSWPVAFLTTFAFGVAGYAFFNFLLNFSRQSLLGGGPFESLIRLLTHANQMTELTPTVAVVTAKTLDSLVMPIMSRLVYIVPNFPALDVSNTVADGFAVSWGLMASNLLLTIAYIVPFSIAAYFILKNREVAA
jgi:hypothetical protein